MAGGGTVFLPRFVVEVEAITGWSAVYMFNVAGSSVQGSVIPLVLFLCKKSRLGGCPSPWHWYPITGYYWSSITLTITPIPHHHPRHQLIGLMRSHITANNLRTRFSLFLAVMTYILLLFKNLS